MGKRKRREDTTYKYGRPEPPMLVLDYTDLADFYGRNEFSKRLTYVIREKLKETIGIDMANRILESLKTKKLKLVNTTSFFRNYTETGDIGTETKKKIISSAPNDFNLSCFVQEVCRKMQYYVAQRNTHIDLSSSFLYMAHYAEGLDLTKKDFDYLISGVAGISANRIKGMFMLNILTPNDLSKMIKVKGLNKCSHYYDIVNAYLDSLCFYASTVSNWNYLPYINIILPITDDAEEKQKLYLQKVFDIERDELETILGNISSLSFKSIDLISAITRIKNATEKYDINTYGVISQLGKIAEENAIHTYPELIDLKEISQKNFIRDKFYKTLNIGYLFPYEKEFFNKTYEHLIEVAINCSSLSIEEIEIEMGFAAELLSFSAGDSLEKSSVLKAAKENGYVPVLKISLHNIKELNKKFFERLNSFRKILVSKHNKEFIILPYFDKEFSTTLQGEDKPEYIRIISDIHADVNSNKNFIYDFGNDFVINCGDTSGDAFTTRNWIKTYMKHGVNVVGNHLGYTDLQDKRYLTTVAGQTLDLQPCNAQTQYLKYTFNRTTTPFLEKNKYEYDDMIFYGCKLCTNFSLYGKKQQAACEQEAMKCMNDFRKCSFLRRKDDTIVPFSIEDHKKECTYGIRYLKMNLNKLRERKNTKPIIVVTHHAPSIYSISPKYKNDPLSAAFASDLTKVMDEYPEIRLWVHGHVHEPFDYIYNKTRVIANPFGYYWENMNEFKSPEEIKNYGKRVKISDIKSDKSWKEILTEEIEKGLIKIYEKDEDVQKVFEKG